MPYKALEPRRMPNKNTFVPTSKYTCDEMTAVNGNYLHFDLLESFASQIFLAWRFDSKSHF